MCDLAYRAGLISATLIIAGWTLPTPIETVLHDFKGPPGDGVSPSGGLIADKDGALYGVTLKGGAAGANGYGTVFKLTPPASGGRVWTEEILYSFKGGAAADGDALLARLIVDKIGALYGTTESGGIDGAGTVFKLTPPDEGQAAWTEAVVYRFKGGDDGSNPSAGLIAGRDGALYGTTLFGGGAGKNGHGTIFKLTPPAASQTAWTETILYRFKGGSDGANPYAGLIADGEGALYGTTLSGGTIGKTGAGTVFKLTPPAPGGKAWTETVIYRFGASTGDGDTPQAGLVAGRDGSLYGATFLGGSSGNKGAGYGTIFRLTPPPAGETAWTETVLYRFCSQPDCRDGSIPQADLIADKDGALYGTTLFGGSACALYPEAGCGTVFKLTPPEAGSTVWTHSVLYRFPGAPDGVNPLASLTIDRQGALYGATTYGGSSDADGNGYGTVFRLTLCLEPNPTDGHDGDKDDGCPAVFSMK